MLRSHGRLTSSRPCASASCFARAFENSLRLTLAGRYTTVSQSAWGGPANEAEHFTPRIGLSYSIDENTSVYGLYDQAFIPQTGPLTDGGEVKPITGSNREIGIKRDWFNGRWNTTLSAYNIIKQNELTADPNSSPTTPTKIVVGEKSARGIEFDIRGQITDGLNVVANYAFTEVVVTESNVPEIEVGDMVPGYSKHVANAWLNYTLQEGKLKGFGVSLGGTWLGDRMTDSWSEGSIRLPNYFKLDGGLSYETGKIKITGNVFNILDEYLYSGSYYEWLSAYYWQAEAPRNYRLGVAYKF